MSLETALEKYPRNLPLKDGTPVVIRPLTKRDESRFHKLFLVVPEAERLFIKCRVTDRHCLHNWFRTLDYEINLPLLMLHKEKVVGEATLHQRMGGWKRHIGLVTVLTHPDYRGRDVAKLLVQDLIEIARHLGLKKLEAELNGERKVAIKALQELGFRELYRLSDYVLDMGFQSHDYVMLGMDLLTDEEYASSE
jgi:GNAT superfamily N-acetyltransferase